MQLPFFYEPILPTTSALLTVSEQTSKHCVQVLRMQVAEKILLTDGAGLLTEASIVTADKKRMVVQTSRGLLSKPPTQENTLAISFVKNPSRMEWLLEKITEIGITEIIPLITSRTEKISFKRDRWDGILVSAMLQSRQVYKPILHEPTKLENILSMPFNGSSLIAHCMPGTKSLKEYVLHGEKRRVLIGPEGDFTKNEVAEALAKGFLALDLGSTRLRTETAGLVAVTLLQHH